jgi:predicted AAA+ superfamily ATPase
MLLFEVRKFSESSYQRLRNPAKLYLVDNGLAKRVTSTDFGRLLENVVFLELTRKGSELFYFEMEKECDFIAKNDKQWEAYQVCWDLNESNREREFSGLKGACESLGLKEGTLLTYDQEGEEKQGPTTIHIKPVWKWLLTQS